MSLASVLTPPNPFWADLQSPLADRLAVLWCADSNFEIVSRTFGTPSGSSPPVLGVSDVGKIYVFPGGGATVSYLDFGVQAVHADIAKAQPFTVFFVGSPTSNGVAVAHSDNNGSQGFVSGLMGIPSVGARIVWSSSNASITGTCTLSAATSGGSRAYLVSVDGQNLTSSGKTYDDGNPLTTTSTAGSGTQNSDSAQHLCIGGNNTNGPFNNCWVGGLKMVSVWRRTLTPAEAVALFLDPMLLYRSSRRRRHRIGGLAIANASAVQPVVFACT